jgi:hypothetical protein
MYKWKREGTSVCVRMEVRGDVEQGRREGKGRSNLV